MELETADRRRKRIIQAVFIVLMAVLLFFTLFSNTLQSLALPKVRTEKPASGSLDFTLEAGGVLQPLSEARLLNPAGWKVRKILVKQGDRVKKGRQLVTYDSSSAERELEDEITNLGKLQIELQNLQDQFIQSSGEGDAFKIRSAGRAIETLKLDIGTQQRRIGEMRDILARQQAIVAPFDGIVAQLNAVEGLPSGGEPDVLLTNGSLGYRLDISADAALLASLGVAVGEKLTIDVHNAQQEQSLALEGIVDAVTDAVSQSLGSPGGDTDNAGTVPRKLLRLKVADPRLKGGEQAQIKLEKPSRQQGLIVPNEAVHREGDELFVYKIEERRGALGNQFIARKVRVQSSETNGRQTMIQSDILYGDEMIVLESGEPLQDGNRVRLQ